MSKTVVAKFLHFTDSHIKCNAPSSRTDKHYLDTILNKFYQLFDFAQDNGVHHILCSGDLGDLAVWSKTAEIEFAGLLRENSNIRLFTTIGNHDAVGKNSDNYLTGTIGLLETVDLLDVVTWRHPVKFQFVDLVALEFGNPILKRDNPYFLERENFTIALVHDTVGPNKSPYWKDIHDIDIINCDLALYGDVHCGFGPITLPSGCVAINPGSFVRTSSSQTHHPAFLHITVYSDKTFDCERIPLDIKEDVFKPMKEKTPTNVSETFIRIQEEFSKLQFQTPEEKIRKVGADENFSQESIDLVINNMRG